MKKEILEHIIAVLEYYADTSSGKEEDNADANMKALNYLYTLL